MTKDTWFEKYCMKIFWKHNKKVKQVHVSHPLGTVNLKKKEKERKKEKDDMEHVLNLCKHPHVASAAPRGGVLICWIRHRASVTVRKE